MPGSLKMEVFTMNLKKRISAIEEAVGSDMDEELARVLCDDRIPEARKAILMAERKRLPKGRDTMGGPVAISINFPRKSLKCSRPPDVEESDKE